MLLEKNKKVPLFVMIILILLILAGCGNRTPEISDTGVTRQDSEVYSFDKKETADTERIAEILNDIYEEAVNTPSGHSSMPYGDQEETSTLGSPDILRRMVAGLGENGYVAVDGGNQIDMTQAEQALAFCRSVDEKERDELTIIVVMEMGIRQFDLKTEDGNVTIVRGYYQYDQNGGLQNRSTVSYPADFWQYTEV